MPFPETIAELTAAGYKFDGDANCRGCGAPVEWWDSPKGKKIPMDVDPEGNCVTHFATCPKAKEFRNEQRH